MKIRRSPEIREESQIRVFHDWTRDDHTKFNNSINYCSINTDNIPEKPGVYFFYCNNTLVYVGISNNIKRRIKNHVSINKHIIKHQNPLLIDRNLHFIDKVEFEVYPEEDLKWIEQFYICKLKPQCHGFFDF